MRKLIDWIKCSFGSHTVTSDDLFKLDAAGERSLPIITKCKKCGQKIAVNRHPTAAWLHTIEEID